MITEIFDPYSDKHAREKRSEFERMTRIAAVSLQLDARRPGVEIPDSLLRVPNLLLKFSPRFPTRMVVSAFGVRQELSFRGVWVSVFVPWGAVYAMHPDKQGESSAVWASDVPAELRRAFGMDPCQVN